MSLPTKARPQPDRPVTSALRRAKLAPALAAIAGTLGVMVIAIFAWQAGLSDILWPNPPPAIAPVENPEQVTVNNANINGIDRDKQPYTLTAKGAAQDKDASRVHLQQVLGTFRRASGEVVTLEGNIGLYDSKARTLDLEGAVKIASAGRFTAAMDKARVEVRSKSLSSDVSVEAEFGSGTIHANGLQITNDGKNILFLNKVKARFKPSPGTGDGTP